MTKRRLAWLTSNELEDDEVQTEQQEMDAERVMLKEMGAPDTDEIEFISIEPEGRNEEMVEALVTPAFIKWAKQDRKTGEDGAPNGISNLVYYDDEEDLEATSIYDGNTGIDTEIVKKGDTITTTTTTKDGKVTITTAPRYK